MERLLGRGVIAHLFDDVNTTDTTIQDGIARGDYKLAQNSVTTDKLTRYGLNTKASTEGTDAYTQMDMNELINVKTLDSGVTLANLKDGKTRVIVYPDGTAHVGGDRAWRTNSPGNMQYTKGIESQYGKFGLLGGDHEGDAYDKKWRGQIYPDADSGNRARMDMLQRHYGDYDITNLGKKYQKGQTPEQYKKNILARMPKGFDANKKLSKYTPDELDLLAKAQTSVERMHAGSIFKVKDYSKHIASSGFTRLAGR